MSNGESSRLPPLVSGRGSGISLGLPRGRGGGPRADNVSGRTSSPLPSSIQTLKYDEAVRSTDGDAVGSRIAAIKSGYLEVDAYTTFLGPPIQPAPRSPIINIGTYLRCKEIDRLVERFLKHDDVPKQIVSLGAGSDARYWRIRSQTHLRNQLHHYVELDFVDLTKMKAEKILRQKELLGLVSSSDDDVRIAPDHSSIQSSKYSLLPCDLRTLQSSSAIVERMKHALDPDKDTLILAECVLAYLSPSESAKLLSLLSSMLLRPFAVCYEMCVAGDCSSVEADPDKLGAVMLTNLQARNLLMPGARAYSTVQSHALRFEKILGKGKGKAKTLMEVWQDIDDTERARLSRVQGLDEVEELEMLLAHYAISWYAYDANSAFLE